MKERKQKKERSLKHRNKNKNIIVLSQNNLGYLVSFWNLRDQEKKKKLIISLNHST